jgi:uncharacterized damage-inducible protein DinB
VIDTAWCRLMADYNAWMNRSLYMAAARLDDAERKADRGAFFKSIHGTLNHLLYADLAWLYRFSGRPLDGLDPAAGLDEDFEALRQRRIELDAELSAWVETLSADWLAAEFSYYSLAYRKSYTRPAWSLVAHLFNHQTHHRGQVTTLLMQAGIDPGVTDLPMLPRLAAAD